MHLSREDFTNFVYKWKETYELSFELADVTFTILNEVVDYCKTHNIPIIEEQGLWNLVTKARSIFTNLEEINSPNLNIANINRRFLTRAPKKNKTDGDLTEPPGFVYDPNMPEQQDQQRKPLMRTNLGTTVRASFIELMDRESYS